MTSGVRRPVSLFSWLLLWVVVVLLLQIAPYVDSVYPRDTIGHSYVPSFLLAPVVLGVILTTLFAPWVSMRRSALLLLPLISVLLIVGGTGLSLLLPRDPVPNRQIVPDATNVYLAIVFGAPLLGLALVGRRTRACYGIGGLALAGVAFFARAWESYSLIVWESGILEAELTQFVWKIPLVGVLAGSAALVAARERLGMKQLPPLMSAAVLPGIAAVLLLVPFRYPSVWQTRQIDLIDHARLLPNGELAMEIIPSAELRVRQHTTLVLDRDGRLRCPFRRPATWFSTDDAWNRTQGIGGSEKIPSLLPGSLLDLIRERPRYVAIGDVRTGELNRVCEEIWAGWQAGRMCRGVAIGSDSAWAVQSTDAKASTVQGKLPGGSRFKVSMPRSVSMIWFSPTHLEMLSTTPLSGKTYIDSFVEGTPHIDRVDLTTAEKTSTDLPIGTMAANTVDLFIEPSGRGFVTRIDARKDENGKLFFVTNEGRTTLLGESPMFPVVLWNRNGSPTVVDPEPLKDLFGPRPDGVFLLRQMTVIGGHTYAVVSGPYDRTGYLDDLYEIDSAFIRATLVAKNLRDVQWLRDSVVYVAADRGGDRVVRRWVSGKEQTFLVAHGGPGAQDAPGKHAP